MKNIPEVDYLKIIETMPIVCVDVIIKFGGNQFLFVKRSNEPEKNSWWFVGGRLYKGESLSDCAIRKCKEEVGLDCKLKRFVCCAETIFPNGLNNIPTHSINFVYLMEANSNKIQLDSTSSEYIWIENFKKLELHPYLSESLKLI